MRLSKLVPVAEVMFSSAQQPSGVVFEHSEIRDYGEPETNECFKVGKKV